MSYGLVHGPDVVALDRNATAEEMQSYADLYRSFARETTPGTSEHRRYLAEMEHCQSLADGKRANG
jgi:hypothetical protein